MSKQARGWANILTIPSGEKIMVEKEFSDFYYKTAAIKTVDTNNNIHYYLTIQWSRNEGISLEVQNVPGLYSLDEFNKSNRINIDLCEKSKNLSYSLMRKADNRLHFEISHMCEDLKRTPADSGANAIFNIKFNITESITEAFKILAAPDTFKK